MIYKISIFKETEWNMKKKKKQMKIKLILIKCFDTRNLSNYFKL